MHFPATLRGLAVLTSCLVLAACDPETSPPAPAPEEPEIDGLVLDRDEREETDAELVPHPVGTEGNIVGVAQPGDVRCAVIVGDNTLGVGPKDARDFQAALMALPEWTPPNALYETILAGATKAGVDAAIKRLHAKGCRQMVFFYSGHGSNRQGDQAPVDEAGTSTRFRDEYLSLRNNQATSDDDIDNSRRIYDEELGQMLRDWQVSNRTSRPVAGSGGRQFVYVYPELLVVLHACRSGGFVGGGSDLDARLRERYEILMSARENQRCYARRPVGGVAKNSVFVGNLLDGMSIQPQDRDVTGKSLFDGADDESTAEARRICTAPGGCQQNPQRFTSIPGDGTIILHQQ